jgi:hypothetical protein
VLTGRLESLFSTVYPTHTLTNCDVDLEYYVEYLVPEPAAMIKMGISEPLTTVYVAMFNSVHPDLALFKKSGPNPDPITRGC